MYFSGKNILTHGRRPLYAASRVLNASSASASSVVATCWVNSTKRTYALIRTVRSRAYSSKAGGGASGSGGSGPEAQATPGTGVPLYSAHSFRIYSLFTTLLVCPGKLLNAWTETPTKWYPLPLAIGALLLVAIQYRKKSKRASREVHVDEDGLEVIRLKGPWQARILTSFFFFFFTTSPSQRVLLPLGPCNRCPPTAQHVARLGLCKLP